MANNISEKHTHGGHRSRMRAKLAAHGPGIFDTYELLEMLLYYVIPYRDTNPISKALLARFGSLDGVLSASPEELSEVDGVGSVAAEFISAVSSAELLLGSEMLYGGFRKFTSYDSVGSYFVDYFSAVEENRVCLMLLDNDLKMLGLYHLFSCDFESGRVQPKPFIDIAIKKQASVAITAHNHPHGPFFATPGDRATVSLITKAFSSIGVRHIDHYLVSGKEYIGIGEVNPSKFSDYYEIHKFLETKLEATRGMREKLIGEEYADSLGMDMSGEVEL